MTSAETLAIPSVETEKTVNAPRPFYWSIRRELWEHRSILFAPATVAAAIIVVAIVRISFLTAFVHNGGSVRMERNGGGQDIVAGMFMVAAGLVLITAILTGVFYSLDALLSERRDRSILFWKSLPVSDRTTVLAKAAVPIVVLPGVAFVITIAMNIVLALIFSFGLLIFREPLGDLWSQLPFFQIQVFVLYFIVTCTLWYAPIYGWLLLVSSISRRAALVWAVVPFIGAVGLERFAFRTEYVGRWLQHRLAGGVQAAFHYATKHNGPIGLRDATPLVYLAEPGLWMGLAAFAIFLFLCIRMRRFQGPI
ncbi:ABC transporter permease [Terriglobus albidus]|uniref:ABC transporter permease n=1 Tax=Terriglobus albidus TaxID=1592106 RepID=A0A5B9E9Z2_9BACT|nr:ABC transporter permease [Terriglobus albidus]QEE27925.1 ABC transporter permease [Terriglobus albidus]